MFARSSVFALACLLPFALRAEANREISSDQRIDEAWQKASLFLFKESYQDFGLQDTREARLGRAALLLLQQPKTEANVARAARELEQLASVPGPAPADEPAIAARYLLGRIAQVHRTPADLPAAANHYRRLVAEHPGHLLADQALIKLALIEIYAPGLAREELLARIDGFGRQADALARASSRRDLQLVLASACDYLRLDDERCLRHYLAADAAGVETRRLRGNVTVAIGELARRLGREELSRRYFERYLAEFPRDSRRLLVKDKLAAIDAPPAMARDPEGAR